MVMDLQPRSFIKKIKNNVRCKTTTKASKHESLAMHRLRSGTRDEQSLISYCASCSVLFFLLTLLLLLRRC